MPCFLSDLPRGPSLRVLLDHRSSPLPAALIKGIPSGALSLLRVKWSLSLSVVCSSEVIGIVSANSPVPENDT